jgi:hypothetical protein
MEPREQTLGSFFPCRGLMNSPKDHMARSVPGRAVTNVCRPCHIRTAYTSFRFVIYRSSSYSVSARASADVKAATERSGGTERRGSATHLPASSGIGRRAALITTTPPNEVVASTHDRMPALVSEDVEAPCT